MKRRDWMLVGAGAAAAVAGAAWRLRQPAPIAAPAAALTPPTGPEAEFWLAGFTQPDGQPLDLQALRGSPLVLNFWATWCPPCVKEMPELDRFARQFAKTGGRVLGLAVDNPTAVRGFLKTSPVSYPIGLAGFDGTDLSRKLGNTSGALPFTAVFDRRGVVVQRKLGETRFDELTAWTQAL